jgi:hypothetical protein
MEAEYTDRERYTKSEIKSPKRAVLEALADPRANSQMDFAEVASSYNVSTRRSYGLDKHLSWANKTPFLGLRNLPNRKKREEIAKNFRIGETGMSSKFGKRVTAFNDKVNTRFRSSAQVPALEYKRK